MDDNVSPIPLAIRRPFSLASTWMMLTESAAAIVIGPRAVSVKVPRAKIGPFNPAGPESFGILTTKAELVGDATRTSVTP